MTLREVLQIEIWSKETSRKIVRKFVVPLAIVLGLVCVAYLISARWITPGENRAARETLVQLDGLAQNYDVNAGEYEVRKNLTEKGIAAAKDAAWTIRDKNLSWTLSAYLQIIEIERQRMAVEQEISLRFPEKAQRIAASEKVKKMDFEKLTGFLSSSLHKVLD